MKEPEILDLYDLMLEQIRDLYDGELQQMKVFPKFDVLANSFELREIIERHQIETERQIARLESIFSLLKEEPAGEQSDGIKGIIKEAVKLTRRCKNPEVCDAGLITSIQHINHYEIAGYGAAISYAKIIGRHEIAELLLESIREEKNADWGLSTLAEGQININAKWTSLVNKVKNNPKETGP